jgi:hypothetical protein
MPDNTFLQLASKGTITNESLNKNANNQPSQVVVDHINQLNNYLNQNYAHHNNNDDDDDSTDNNNLSPINCNYYHYDEFRKAAFNSNKSFSIFHLNIHSITRHIDELKTLLLELESSIFQFDILAISESKLYVNTAPSVNITIPNYHPPISTPSEAEKGGVLLYINKNIPDFKIRPDLNSKVYDPKRLESIFIEINNSKISNDIIGVIYRHPKLDLDNFNDDFLSPLMDSLSREKIKTFILLETLMLTS